MPAWARPALYLISADSRKPAIITAPTIEHLKTNRIFLFIPFTMDSLPGVIPPRQRRQYCQHERHALRVRFILLCSFCPPFLCRSHSIEYTHIIPKRQNNASGVCAFAYNVIYIKRRFSCVIFTKTACAIGYFIVRLSQIWKTHKLFFRNPFVQVLWLIVQIPVFTFCLLWLKSKADTITCLVIITYLLNDSQKQCVSTAYNTPPRVSRMLPY